MRIRSLTICGFRGINKELSLELDDRLTLLFGQNSTGKSSISEALEWLLYGQTTKMRGGKPKDEYRGSYRNCHLQPGLDPRVKAELHDDSSSTVIEKKMVSDDASELTIDGQPADKWPFAAGLDTSPYPFILQHDLKYLILSDPDGRFAGLAHLLGFDDLDSIQKAIHALCTKPSIPKEVEEVQARAKAIQDMSTAFPALGKQLDRKSPDLFKAKVLAAKAARQWVPSSVPDNEVIQALKDFRNMAVRKVFEGSIALPGLDEKERTSFDAHKREALSIISGSLPEDYLALASLVTEKKVLDSIKFFAIGIEMLKDKQEQCPFCGQPVTSSEVARIRSAYDALSQDEKRYSNLKDLRRDLEARLGRLDGAARGLYEPYRKRADSFMPVNDRMEEIRSLMPDDLTAVKTLSDGVTAFEGDYRELGGALTAFSDSLQSIRQSLETGSEQNTQIEQLSSNVTNLLSRLESLDKRVNQLAPVVHQIEGILQSRLDEAAGTKNVSVLITILEQWPVLEKAERVSNVLDSLKVLRSETDRFVSKTINNSVSQDLTKSVMDIYDNLKTVGDPDVHFSGFDLEKNKDGSTKSRRIEVKAKSYGVDLVSAVACLSESKLNALGLSLKLATNLGGDSPFNFLILDDPVQSLDAEHEEQLIAVLRGIVESGKQVILLSHNLGWLKRVRDYCRSLNGRYYEIKGYSKDGPFLQEQTWAPWDQRLTEARTIFNSQNSSATEIQRAEEELRIVVCDLAAEISRKVTGKPVNPKTLNSEKVRKTLLECGASQSLTDSIVATFGTTDPAHHDPGYTPNRQRGLQYCGRLSTLGAMLRP